MAGDRLPPDSHVHTEWSWDAVHGSMERSCAKAVELGLPAIAFTEHVEIARWYIPDEIRARRSDDALPLDRDGYFVPPPFDVDGYLEEIERCRGLFPDLRVLAGMEVGEPHWFSGEVAGLLRHDGFERRLGSLHTLEVDGRPWLVGYTLGGDPPSAMTVDDVLHAYLTELVEMIESPANFEILAHIDYPVRGWPGDRAFRPTDFEEEFRTALRSLARSGRALEINTRVPLAPEVVKWWVEEGGKAVSFGSDAHSPGLVADDFADAAALAESHGFRPGRDLHDVWRR